MYTHSFDSGLIPDSAFISKEIYDEKGHEKIKIHSVCTVRDDKTNLYKVIVLYTL